MSCSSYLSEWGRCAVGIIIEKKPSEISSCNDSHMKGRALWEQETFIRVSGAQASQDSDQEVRIGIQLELRQKAETSDQGLTACAPRRIPVWPV